MALMTTDLHHHYKPTIMHVVVPRSLVELSEDQETFLDSQVQPLADDENYGIGWYGRTVILVEEFQQELD